MLQDYLIVSCLLICTIHANSLLPKCPAKGTALFADPENEQAYFVCKNSVLVSKTCGDDSVFDEKESKCVQIEQTTNKDEITSVHPTDSKEDGSNENNILTNSVQMHKPAGANDSPFKCPDKNEMNYPYLEDCRKYYRCKNGEYTVETCRILTLFDAKTHQCQLLVQASCFQVTTTQRTTVTTTTTKPLSTCPADSTVVDIPYPEDCRKYFHCVNGSPELKSCWWFQRFDTKKMTCRFYFFSTCYEK